MPSPRHKCANPECTKMISPSATHCKNHVPRTAEWLEKQSLVHGGKVLSAETRMKISRAHSDPTKRISKTCQWCNKNFSIKLSYSLKSESYGKFCSSKCAYAARTGENSPNWNGGKKEYICVQCGKVYLKRPCQVKGNNNFCSYPCNSIYKKANQKNKNTDIESEMSLALNSAGFKYQEQVTLCNTTIADFYLPDFNVAIFCDGDYWHNYPHGKPKDKTQTDALIRNGYTVIRLWGSEIKSSIASCIEKIQCAIN